MDKQYDNELSGVLFVNEKKDPNDPNCKLPNLTGNIQIKGVKYSLSGWTREYQKEGEDKRLVSIKATHPDDMKKFSAKQETPLSSNNDIPF